MIWHTLILYGNRVFWPLCLSLLIIWIVPTNKPAIRIPIYLILFIILRDSLMPLGLFFIGHDGFFWMRLGGGPGVWTGLGLGLCGLIALLVWKEGLPEIKIKKWSELLGILVGFAAGLPLAWPRLLDAYTPHRVRWPSHDTLDILALLFVCLSGGALFALIVYGYLYKFLVDLDLKYKGLMPVLIGLIVALTIFGPATIVNKLGFNLYAYFFLFGSYLSLIRAKSGLLPTLVACGSAFFYLIFDY